VASGTATLEAALARKPMVITYKMAQLTYGMMSKMGNSAVGWVFPNIIAGEFSFQRFSRIRPTPENLAQAVLNSLNDPVVNRRLPERLDQIRPASCAGTPRPVLRKRSAVAAVRLICGVDEAGRGPLAGPVCAAAVGSSRDGARPPGSRFQGVELARARTALDPHQA